LVGLLLATPEVLMVTGEPNGFPSMVNVTVPVGVPWPAIAGATVALKLTASPGLDGFSDEVSVVVLALRISSVIVWLVVGRRAPWRVCRAKTLWKPRVSVLVGYRASPDASSATVATTLPSMLMSTKPDGGVGKPPGVTSKTVSVKVTIWPSPPGLADVTSE